MGSAALTRRPENQELRTKNHGCALTPNPSPTSGARGTLFVVVRA